MRTAAWCAAEQEPTAALKLECSLGGIFASVQMSQVAESLAGWAQGQMEDHETPMTPATAMRNALGREEGGSGVPLDRVAYERAVAYWDAHALLSAGTTPG